MYPPVQYGKKLITPLTQGYEASQRRVRLLAAILLIVIGSGSVSILVKWHYNGLFPYIDILEMGALLLMYLIVRLHQVLELPTNQQRYQIVSELVSDYAFALRIGRNQIPTLEWDMGQDNLFGFKLSSFFGGTIWNYVHPQDVEKVRMAYTNVLNGEKDETEFRVLDRGGDVHWVRAKTWRVENDVIYGAISDITLHKTVEDTLYQRGQEFRALVENSPDLIARIDREMRHLYVNPAFETFSGIKTQDYIGKTPRELGMLESEAVEWETVLGGVFESGQEATFETEITAKGERRVLESRITPEFDAASIVQTILVISRDVTERTYAEQQHVGLVRQQERAQVLERFMREAAHDLITPLTTMKTNLYLMRRTTDDPRMSRRVELLEDETSHIEASINALLKMTRINQESFEFEKSDLNLLVGKVINLWQTQAEQRRIPLIFEPGINIPAVMLDQTEFQYVVQELLKNAIAYSIAEQTILVRTRTEGDYIRLSVIDHGEGIAPDDLEFIFEPFYRAPAREVSKGGIGLGLTIAKWIVQVHDGTITVESTLCEGSTFHVILPVKRKQ